MPPGGYTWWYIDAISEDGNSALVIIIFVGSVFSPYYAWSGRSDPNNHCALNIALYDRQGDRWAMTERPKSAIERTTDTFAVGPSRVDRTSDGLSIRVLERGAPLPRAVNGTVEVRLPWQNTRRFQLHPSGRHTWQPICTAAEVSVAFDAPKRTWTGRAYVDTNWGTEPLETGFDYWDWSRTEGPDGSAKIRYVSDLASGGATDFCVGFDTSGEISTHTLEPQTTLPPTPIWRIPRRAGLLNGETPELMRTLEDTPFYSRSLLNHPASGVRAVHESFSGKRLRSNLIKSLLMVRMPRR